MSPIHCQHCLQTSAVWRYITDFHSTLLCVFLWYLSPRQSVCELLNGGVYLKVSRRRHKRKVSHFLLLNTHRLICWIYLWSHIAKQRWVRWRYNKLNLFFLYVHIYIYLWQHSDTFILYAGITICATATGIRRLRNKCFHPVRQVFTLFALHLCRCVLLHFVPVRYQVIAGICFNDSYYGCVFL